MSSRLVAMGPGVSLVSDNLIAMLQGHLPTDDRNPIAPLHTAGILTDPPVSEPIDKGI